MVSLLKEVKTVVTDDDEFNGNQLRDAVSAALVVEEDSAGRRRSRKRRGAGRGGAGRGPTTRSSREGFTNKQKAH